MRKLLVIGIGAGDPEYLTIQAVKALNAVDVFFLLDKASTAPELAEARELILERYVADPKYRTVNVIDPPRDRAATDYEAAVDEWRDERAERLAQAIVSELDQDGCGGLLVWGDPAVYDGTIAIIETMLARGILTADYEVIPGISSIQALAARHRTTLNPRAGTVHITTGRRLLAEGLPDDADDIVVMLDPDLACTQLAQEDLEIRWGAYLGTSDEVLVAGRLADVSTDLRRIRDEARERKGWIMDSYLLRRQAARPINR